MKNKEQWFYDSKRNDMFSLFRGLDLQQLIVHILNFNPIYRKMLNMPEKVSIGIELEYENLNKNIVDRFISRFYSSWSSKTDSTLTKGGEISSPILHNQIQTWKDIKKICDFLKQHNVITNQSAGGHIHYGAHILGDNPENWLTFFDLIRLYEHVLFRFGFGECINARADILEFAHPIADKLSHKVSIVNSYRKMYGMKKKFDVISIIPADYKYQSFNFLNVDFDTLQQECEENTIEIRYPNATVNEIILQNNINVNAHFLMAASSNTIDKEFLNYKMENYEFSSYEHDPHMYYEVCLRHALELADLIFDNNLDKVYFLWQYLKGFQTSYGTKTGEIAKIYMK